MEIVFKKVPLEDIEIVYKLYCEIEGVEATIKDIEKAKEIYKNKILPRDSYTYAGYIDNNIVATVNVYKNWQMWPTDLDDPFVHLECVMVSPNYQGKGIGTELIINIVTLVYNEGVTYTIGQSPVEAMQHIFYKAGLTETNCKDFRKNYDKE